MWKIIIIIFLCRKPIKKSTLRAFKALKAFVVLWVCYKLQKFSFLHKTKLKKYIKEFVLKFRFFPVGRRILG